MYYRCSHYYCQLLSLLYLYLFNTIRNNIILTIQIVLDTLYILRVGESGWAKLHTGPGTKRGRPNECGEI